jgi:dinuclear metal center YbgI/SA1388 family protein
MSVKCRTIMEAMEELAPVRLAAGWDNVGLLVGSPEQEVRSLLVALDVTPAVAEAAAAGGVDLIVAHHPLIFKGLTSIRTDQPVGRALATLLRAGVAVFAAHTNLDAADGGVNDILAAKLGLTAVRPLAADYREGLLKIVVFVPESHVEAVRQAMAGAGAGHIGNYSHCSFQAPGTGTFLPLAGTNPFIGQTGKLEYVSEFRLETIIPANQADKVVKAMLKAHPYEEVAYDLYRLENAGRDFGVGRVGELARQLTLADFISEVKSALSIGHVRLSGPAKEMVKTAAVCGGAGASLFTEALRVGADVLVTGDVKYHEALEAAEQGLTIIGAGHFASERLVLEAVAARLAACSAAAGWNIAIKVDDISSDVFSVC